MILLGMVTEADLDRTIRETDWSAELATASARYEATPWWRPWRRRAHLRAVESALWFLTYQEAGRL